MQKLTGGNTNIGRELSSLLNGLVFSSKSVSPRIVYLDLSNSGLEERFTKSTLHTMIEGVRDFSIAEGLIGKTTFDYGIRALYRTIEKDGVVCHMFFKAIITK